MIKSNELRIGNWVRFMHPAKPYNTKVVAQHIFDVGVSDKIFEPIPLTPEILEKAGFERFSETEHFKCYAISIDNDNEILLTIGQQFPFIEFNGWQRQDATFQHLHQLQNLYFALTGEELNIQL